MKQTSFVKGLFQKGAELLSRGGKAISRFARENAAVLVTGGTMVFACAARATDPPTAQEAIVSAGTTVAGYAGAAGAAGVGVMVVIWGIRVASRAIKAPK